MAPSFGPNVPLLNKARSYDTWKKEIELWCKITELSKEKLGITIALALPDEECQFGKDIKSDVLDNVTGTQLFKISCQQTFHAACVFDAAYSIIFQLFMDQNN